MAGHNRKQSKAKARLAARIKEWSHVISTCSSKSNPQLAFHKPGSPKK